MAASCQLCSLALGAAHVRLPGAGRLCLYCAVTFDLSAYPPDTVTIHYRGLTFTLNPPTLQIGER